MSKLFSILFLFILLPNFANGQDTLKVMTYNIYHGEQFYNRGESNLEGVAQLINQIDPDFVAFQEVDSLTARSAEFNDGVPEDLVKTLAELTGMVGYFGKAIDYEGGGYGEGILSGQPLNSRSIMLPIPKGGEDRTVLMVEATTASGRPFIFAGTHLCHQYSENRMAQVKEINDFFSGISTPVILGGDFNIAPNQEQYEELLSMWADAAVMFNNTSPTISYQNPRRRIDYLFLSANEEWEVLDLKVISTDHSDHMPVLATVVLH